MMEADSPRTDGAEIITDTDSPNATLAETPLHATITQLRDAGLGIPVTIQTEDWSGEFTATAVATSLAADQCVIGLDHDGEDYRLRTDGLGPDADVRLETNAGGDWIPLTAATDVTLG